MKDQLLQPIVTVRDLGVVIDSQLTMEAHVRNVVSSCFYQLWQLRSIQWSLPTYAQWTLAAAFVFIASRVDYCNGVRYGVSSQVIRQLQMVLNAAARLVVNVGRYEHITTCFIGSQCHTKLEVHRTCLYNVRPKPKPTFWPMGSNEYRSSAKLRPNIYVLWRVFDNALNTLQFHQNTTLQLYNVYK